MIARDALWVALAAALAGLAWDDRHTLALGLAAAFGALGVALLATLGQNLIRLRLIRRARRPRHPRPRPPRLLLHELFRGQDERTFALPYRFDDPDGRPRRGTLWICGCARDRLPKAAKSGSRSTRSAPATACCCAQRS
ncbi:MAG: hypothetical protein H6703_03835 [Myxococcales bacterium]|nr:hypothetical protein [Myxococcales bacterium]